MSIMSNADSLQNMVRDHYPNAMSSANFKKEVLRFLVDQGFKDVSKVLLAVSQCADDVNALRDADVTVVRRHFSSHLLGPFELGGLAGIPYGGLTGISTIAHHVPDDGIALIVYGPHIGLSCKGHLGKLMRPGQAHESAACGSLTLAVQNIMTQDHFAPYADPDDLEQGTLERKLLPFKDQIVQSENPLKTATDIVYSIIKASIYSYLHTKREAFALGRVLLAGTITINTSPDHDDYIDLRDLEAFHLRNIESI